MGKNLWKAFVFAIGIVSVPAYALELVKDGKTDYLVVVGTNGVYDRFAASEFHEIMKRSTGADFKRVKAGSPEAASAKKRVLIGDSPELRRVLNETEIRKLSNLESLVMERGNDLVIVGGGNHGTAYGVYHFLETEIGFRCFNPFPGGERVPLHKDLVTQGKELRRKIAFPLMRHAYMIYLYDQNAPLYIYRNSGNANARASRKSKLKGLLRDDFSMMDSGHGFFLYIPDQRYINFYPWDEPKDYFKTNPEFFSLGRDGKRTTHLQLCFSNKELRKEFSKRVLERGRKVGGKGVLTIGANDVPGSFCFCPECLALEKKYGTKAGPLFDFIPELCATVAKELPDLRLSTLAYRKAQSEVPPENIQKMPDNWICDFAPVDDDQGQALDGEKNLGTLKNLKDWNKLTNNITYWYYLCIDSAPFGVVERLSRDMKTMYENGVRGVGVCGLASPGMFPMQEYLMLRLMIDPYQDAWRIVEEYNAHMYGPAAKEMNDYVRELDAVWKTPQKYAGLVESGENLLEFTPERLLRWQEMFDRLEKKLAGKPYELKNLSIARWDVDMLTLLHWSRITQKPSHLTPEKIIVRMRNAPLPKRYSRTNMKVRAENAYLVCMALSKPIPAPLNKLPKEQLIQLPQCGGFHGRVDPDASCGNAKTQPFRDGQMSKSGKKIGFDIYDQVAKRMIKHGEIDVSNVKGGEYQLYFIAKTIIPRGGSINFDSWWGINASLAPYYPEGDEFREFELWASLKFEGPSFGTKTKDGKDRMFCDRMFIVDKTK